MKPLERFCLCGNMPLMQSENLSKCVRKHVVTMWLSEPGIRIALGGWNDPSLLQTYQTDHSVDITRREHKHSTIQMAKHDTI